MTLKETFITMLESWEKIVASISVVLLAITLLIAHYHPASGYELDIYANTPIVVWIFIGIGFFNGLIIILYQVLTKRYETNQIWFLGLIVLLLTRLTLLCIPYIRGYITWNGDNITHWGFLKDVLLSGHFHIDNFYPLTHSFLSSIIILTNIPIQIVSNTSTAFMSIFFVLFTYLLSTAILPKRGQQLLATTIAGAVMLGGGYEVFLMPNGWSILMLPLLFYFYFKFQSIPTYLLLFLLVLIIYPFFHPLSSLLLIISLLVIYLFHIGNLYLKKKQQYTVFTIKNKTTFISSVLEMIIFTSWILSFHIFNPNIKLIWEQIISGGSNIIGEAGETLFKINVTGFNVIILYIKLYGAISFLSILSLVGFILILRRKKENIDHYEYWRVRDVGVIFLLLSLLYLFYWFGMPGMESIQGVRILTYIAIFTPVLAALVLDNISHVSKSIIINLILLCIFIIVPAGLSFRDLYRSPYDIQPNLQITQKEMTGMRWFIENKNIDIGTISLMSSPSRLADGILGVNLARSNFQSDDLFSDHFGYNDYDTLAEQYKRDKYGIITILDRMIYSTVWQAVGRFDEADFIQLEADTTVDKFYTNGETDIYYISWLTY